MEKIRSLIGMVVLLASVIFVLSACTSNEGKVDKGESEGEGEVEVEGTEQAEKEPVTLRFNYGWEEEFIEDIQEPLKEKFPHITLEFAEMALEEVEQEIAKNNIPDILYLSGGDKVGILEEFELIYDLDPLIEEQKYDLSHISQAQLDMVKTWGNGKLPYFPYVKRWDVLYYNKQIFDQFGVEYPKDGMTWDEIAELAKNVTGELNGKEYRGIDLSSAGGMLNQLELNHLDPETDESLYVKDSRFADYLAMVEKIAAIPGVIVEDQD